MKVGYIRVSTVIQEKGYSLDFQEKELRDAGCERIFSDVASGAKADRKGLKEMKEFVRPGDVVVIYKLDRLSRTLKELLNITSEFNKKNIQLISMTEKIDTTSSYGKLFFHIIGAFAEFDRDIIKERTQIGINAARARGISSGRKRILDDTKKEQLRALFENPQIRVNSIAKTLGCDRTTVYKYAHEMGLKVKFKEVKDDGAKS